MSIPRFYCPEPLSTHAVFEMPPAAAHHASRVLRLRVNDTVQLFDGTGMELHGRISQISGKKVVLEKLQTCAVNRESPLPLVLAQALCSSEKMDWVVQKATELGIAEIQPVQTQRSVAKLSAERAEKRTDHWRGVTISACEQCGRNQLPVVHAPQEFGAWLTAMRQTAHNKFILLPSAISTLHEQTKPQGTVILLIGPEGGFEEEEAQLAQHSGFIAVRLGGRILRTETAAVAAITAMQTLWGDL